MEQFPGHIACDAESASEIVVPIMQGGKVSLLSVSSSFNDMVQYFGLENEECVESFEEHEADCNILIQVVAIIDVDCAVKDGFDEEDKKYLEELAELIAESCDF